MRNKNRAFLDALLDEVRRQGASHAIEPETIYFGGGTPSMLSLGELEYLLTGLRLTPHGAAGGMDFRNQPLHSFPRQGLPASPPRREPHQHGRAILGRRVAPHAGPRAHGRAGEGTFHLLRAAGFENINLDLMFGIPGQSREQWQRSLRHTAALGPEHVSAYCLTYEEDTRYFEQLRSRRIHPG